MVELLFSGFVVAECGDAVLDGFLVELELLD